MKKAKLLLKILFCASVFSLGLTACSDKTQSSFETFTTTGAPSDNMGKNGDRCVDSLTNDVYEKQNGHWVLIQHGTPAYLTGAGEPSADQGVNGDFYTDTLTNQQYRKENGEWKPYGNAVEQVTVSFDLNGGRLTDGSTTLPNQVLDKGDWADEPEQPTKANTTFKGWYPNGNTTTAWVFTNPVMGDLNLVAMYNIREEDKVTLTVDPGNGGETYTFEGMAGDIARLTNPSRTGYDFKGWYFVDASGNTTDEQFTGTLQSSHNGRTVRAVFEKAKFAVMYRVEANNEVTVTGLIDIETVSITIPAYIEGKPVTAVSKSAFNNRYYLQEIILPATMKDFPAEAVAGTARLQTISVDLTNPVYESVDGVLFKKGKTELVCFPIKHGTSYTVPSTVKSIADYAFYGGSYSILQTIYFNEGLQSIGRRAFYMNPAISSINFPSTLRTIGEGAFSCVSSDYGGALQNVTFNDGLLEIGDSAFCGAYFKDNFTLPATVKKIGEYAFANCTAITKFTLPRDLETLGFNAFAGATGIMELDVASGNTHFKVDDGVIYDFAMTKVVMCASGRCDPVTVPAGVTEIGDGAFYMCDNLQEYHFPTSLTKIGKEAFAQCYELKSFVIPDTVTEIGKSAFDFCEDLASIQIGTGLSVIPEYAFADCYSLTEIVIPSNIRTIEYGAFFGCSRVTSITFNEGLETIGVSAFRWSNTEYNESDSAALTSIVFPNSLQSIGQAAFSGQKALKTVQFGNSLTSIDYLAFTETGIETITLSAGNNNLKVGNDNKILYTGDEKEVIFAAPTLSGNVTLPETVEKIRDFAFYDARYITAINFPTALQEIGEGAFYLSHITTASFGSNLRVIKDGAFDMSDLETVTFAEGIQEIGMTAFEMTAIQSLSLPNSLQKIGETAFANSLQLETLTFGNGLTDLGERAFQNCVKLTGTIELPASLQNVGASPFAMSRSITTQGAGISGFAIKGGTSEYLSIKDDVIMNKAETVVYGYAIGNLRTELALPNTVTEIADYAFMYATHIQRLTLSTSLEKIGYYSLAYMTSVSSIDIPATVNYIDERAFEGWGSGTHAPVMNFHCTEDYALMHFEQWFLSGVGSNAKIKYLDE